jgi:hypothetical protein
VALGRRCGRANVVLRIDDPQLGRVLEKRWQVQPPRAAAIMPQQWTVQTVKRAPDAVAGLLPNGAGCRRRAAAGAARAGRPARGRHGAAGRGETEWRFAPAQAWRAGRYMLRVHPQLEDPQGNRLCSAFEQAGQSAQQCDDEGGASLSSTNNL